MQASFKNEHVVFSNKIHGNINTENQCQVYLRLSVSFAVEIIPLATHFWKRYIVSRGSMTTVMNNNITSEENIRAEMETFMTYKIGKNISLLFC